jgi:UDP-glucuronate 4-epimerase
MRVLVTGGAGFIGSHLAEALLRRGDEVICLDNFNDYYEPARKWANIRQARQSPGYTLVEGDFRDVALVEQVFAQQRPQRVAHLGAMAGPRPSLARPLLYQDVNVGGTLVLLDAARRHDVSGFVLASTSSVYGRSATPWSETSPSDRPLSPYAATKKAAEVLATTYQYQYGMPTTIVRFFTVYGPRGRPDMTPAAFVAPMRAGRPITLFNGGVGVFRDWTYIDDIVAGVVAALDAALPCEIINLGNSQPVELLQFVATLERVTGLTARIEAQPLPAADPPITYADIAKAGALLGFAPRVQIDEGLARYWEWACREA